VSSARIKSYLSAKLADQAKTRYEVRLCKRLLDGHLSGFGKLSTDNRGPSPHFSI
jgi:hypothetical protein